MRKNVFGRQFSRDRNERQALFKGLLSSLVLEGRIETTLEKAKAIKPSADKLVSKSRKSGSLAKRLLEQELFPAAVEKMLTAVAPRFAKRSGGYTRIIRIGRRFGDAAPKAIIEWVEGEAIGISKSEDKPKKKIAKTKAAKSEQKKPKTASKVKPNKKGAKTSR